MNHQTHYTGFDVVSGLLIFQCDDCPFRAGAWVSSERRPRIFEAGTPGVQHQWNVTPTTLTPDQWRALGVEPMGQLDLGIGARAETIEE